MVARTRFEVAFMRTLLVSFNKSYSLLACKNRCLFANGALLKWFGLLSVKCPICTVNCAASVYIQSKVVRWHTA